MQDHATMEDDEDLVGAPPAKKKKRGPGRPKKTETSEANDVRKNSMVAADELRQLIERWESLEADKKAIASDQKDVMAEAKDRGYDTKVMRTIIAERKKKPDDVMNFNAILELYREVLGMA